MNFLQSSMAKRNTTGEYQEKLFMDASCQVPLRNIYLVWHRSISKVGDQTVERSEVTKPVGWGFNSSEKYGQSTDHAKY